MQRDKLRNLSFHLLRVLQILAQERSTVKAAARLHMSQPAISHALKRLRDELEDPLFVTSRHGLVPTPWAERVLEQLPGLLDAFATLLEKEQSFDPASWRGQLTLALGPNLHHTLGSELWLALARQAPLLDLELRNMTSDSMAQLVKGSLFMVLGGDLSDDIPDIGKLPLTQPASQLYVYMRSGHPLRAQPLDEQALYACEHGRLFSYGRGKKIEQGFADYEGLNLSRIRIRFRTEQPLVLFQTLASTDLIYVTATRYDSFPGVVRGDYPLRKALRGPVAAFCHRRNLGTPQVQWLHQLIETLCRGVAQQRS